MRFRMKERGGAVPGERPRMKGGQEQAPALDGSWEDRVPRQRPGLHTRGSALCSRRKCGKCG